MAGYPPSPPCTSGPGRRSGTCRNARGRARSLVTARRREPKTRDDPWRGADHGDRDCRGRSVLLQLRSTARRFARTGAATELKRWQATPGRHLQTERPIHPASAGCRRAPSSDMRAARHLSERPGSWPFSARRPDLVAAVALANKMARTAWAILARGDIYRPAAVASN
jgi:hypothetical protein